MVELHSNFLFQGSKRRKMASCPPSTRCTKPWRSRRVSRPGLRPVFISLRPCRTARAGRMGRRPHPAARSCARKLALAGRSEFVDRVWDTHARSSRPPSGVLRSGRLSTSRRGDCIGPSILHSRGPTPVPSHGEGGNSRPMRRFRGTSPTSWPLGWSTTAASGRSGGPIPSPIRRSSSFRHSIWMFRRSGRSTSVSGSAFRVTDHMLFKAIIGRRFDWGKRHPTSNQKAPQP